MLQSVGIGLDNLDCYRFSRSSGCQSLQQRIVEPSDAFQVRLRSYDRFHSGAGAQNDLN